MTTKPLEELLLEEETRTQKPPGVRWVNWWRCHVLPPNSRTVCITCGFKMKVSVGDIFRSHCKTYPSKDVAESVAQKLQARRFTPEYIGAYPVGERP